MRRNELKWILIIIGIMVIILLGVLIFRQGEKEEQKPQNNVSQESQEPTNTEKYTEVLEDGTKLNVSEDFNTAKEYNGLEIGNIQYTQRNGVTVLLADVKNPGPSTHEREVVKITIVGENGEVITDTLGVIGEIKAGGSYQLNASFTADVSNAKDFRIEAR